MKINISGIFKYVCISGFIFFENCECLTYLYQPFIGRLTVEPKNTEEDFKVSKNNAENSAEDQKIKIFVCFHKKFAVPKGGVIIPIQVGAANAKEDLGMTKDDCGENISEKNPFFCELTATYRIWKNVKADIVGICHYRRYFNLNDNENQKMAGTDFCENFGLTEQRIRSLSENADIILPKRLNFRNSAYQDYTEDHVKSDMDLVLEIIHKKYPDQYKIAHDTLHLNRFGYFCNMLIARKKVFDDYAAWLFDILFEVEKHIQADVLKRNKYQQRVYGFLAERLMTVYIALHPELKVKEVPMLFISNDHFDRYEKILVRIAELF